MKTSFSRTFVTYVAILLAALLLVGVSFQALVKGFLEDRAIDGLKSHSATIAQVASAYYTHGDMTDSDFLVNLSVAASVSQADAVICDSEGDILLCSHAPLGCEHRGMRITNQHYLKKALTQSFVVSQGLVAGLYDEERYIVSTPIQDGQGRPVGFVLMSTATAATHAVLDRIANLYLSVSVLVVLAAVVAMTIYTRKGSAPLRDLARAANAFGHGDLQARVTVPQDAPDELRELSLAFNNMAQSLEKSEYQRREFIANVSHELKTPMTTIGGYVDGILDNTIPPEQQKKYLQIVSEETKRLSRLVRTMLDISRLQEEGGIREDKKTRFDLAECAGQVLILFEQSITRKDLQVQVDLPEHPVYTHACQDAITQVIYNLVDNAVKFCPQGGIMGLTLKEQGNKLYIRVFNDSQTIPPNELPLVFDRFHKTDKSRSRLREGWGLGLYIVKTIVCSHGEDISVSSADGRTEFTFTLPVSN